MPVRLSLHTGVGIITFIFLHLLLVVHVHVVDADHGDRALVLIYMVWETDGFTFDATRAPSAEHGMVNEVLVNLILTWLHIGRTYFRCLRLLKFNILIRQNTRATILRAYGS